MEPTRNWFSLVNPPLLIDFLPDLADELTLLLKQQGYAYVASQIPMLRMFDRCHCGDDFCATFYTEPRQAGHWTGYHKTINLEVNRGMIIVDLIGSSLV